MNRKLLVATLVVLAAVVATTAAAATGTNGGGDRRLVIGVRVDFTSSTHAEGTFAVCCAVNDSGEAQADVTSFVPHGNIATFEATETFAGSEGTFVVALRGRTGPLDSPNHIARGHWRVVSGTGEYEDLRGHGVFTAVTNQTNGALTAVNDGFGRR